MQCQAIRRAWSLLLWRDDMETEVVPGALVDRATDRMQPFFGGSIGSTTTYNNTTGQLDSAMTKTSQSWFCAELTQTIGSEPAEAKIIIPCGADSVDESAFATVLNPNGPIKDLPHQTA